MRTTIRIDNDLLKEAKRQAILRGKSLTSIIEDALREAFSRQHQSIPRTPVHLTTVSGNGLLPGVDLDDSAALLDVMESSIDPH